MASPIGYIYVRTNTAWDLYNAVKLGIAENLVCRESPYVTSEIKRGNFTIVISIPLNSIKIVEKTLHKYFKSYHIYIDGGTEFYHKDIINLITPFLEATNLWDKFTILNQSEKDSLVRTQRPRINKQLLLAAMVSYHKPVIPLPHQKAVLDNILDFYNSNSIGKLVWSCGLGKTILAVLIAQKLKPKTVVIGVFSKFLQKQFETELSSVFHNHKNILFVGSIIDPVISSTTDKKKIATFMNTPSSDCKFVITTYDSCYLLTDYHFDFKVGDECHHVAGIYQQKHTSLEFHNIKASKSLFMTATEKYVYQPTPRSRRKLFSMDNPKLFGKLIDHKSVYWAIMNKQITDYTIIVKKYTTADINAIISDLQVDVSDTELFISAWTTLESLQTYNTLSHVLVYVNTTHDSDLICNYIDLLLDKQIFCLSKNLFYNKSLHSNCQTKDFFKEVNDFKKSKYGIISCIYIFGEGFNLPAINGVVFAKNMVSDIRITQCALRGNRLHLIKPDKISYLIIPSTNDSNTKVTAIVEQLRETDESIQYKINISNFKYNCAVKANIVQPDAVNTAAINLNIIQPDACKEVVIQDVIKQDVIKQDVIQEVIQHDEIYDVSKDIIYDVSKYDVIQHDEIKDVSKDDEIHDVVIQVVSKDDEIHDVVIQAVSKDDEIQHDEIKDVVTELKPPHNICKRYVCHICNFETQSMPNFRRHGNSILHCKNVEIYYSTFVIT